MFLRKKKSGKYTYIQIVHNERVNGRVRQHVLATLGREDILAASGHLDGLMRSMDKYAASVAVLDACRKGELDVEKIHIGPPLVFERLWKDLKAPQVLRGLLKDRKFGFPVERAVFVTTLHRLFDPGSDRAAEVWKDRYAIPGASSLRLHHLYRAMAWLGEPLGRDEQDGATPFAPRCVKDEIEERLFARHRNLFTELELAFFDTTSIYFEGEGGETLGQYGHSKDHRPDRKQMIVGAVLDERGRPICSELWPGNTADVKTLIPVVNRLRKRFSIGRLCIVADRGMIRAETVEALESGRYGEVRYILGARMRRQKEVAGEVLSRAGRYRVVRDDRGRETDLKVKDVVVGDHRYIVCLNGKQAERDRQNREAILAGLQDALQTGDKALIGNKGYRKYVKTTGGRRFRIDEAKAREEARFDGKWVLRTTADFSSEEAALRYKQLWRVENIFRSVKSVIDTRPIYHQRDATIRGHVFCSFLALLLLKELQDRMDERGWPFAWERLKRDLDDLEEMTAHLDNKTVTIRSSTEGDAWKALQAAGVAPGPSVRIMAKP